MTGPGFSYQMQVNLVTYLIVDINWPYIIVMSHCDFVMVGVKSPEDVKSK